MAERGDRSSSVLETARVLLALGTTLAIGLMLLRFVDVDQVLLLGLVPIAPFIVALGVVTLAATYGLRAFGAAVAAVVLLGALAMPGTLLPRSGCDVVAGRSASSLVIFSHNVLVGNQEVTAVADQLLAMDPDVVLLQEAPDGFVAALETVLDGRFPYRESTGFQSILSRWPLTDVKITGTATGGALIATTTAPDQQLRIANFHASAPLRAERRANQRVEYGDMREWRVSESVDVVMGDFNAAGSQPLYRQLVGDGFVDAHRSAGCGFGLTWKRLQAVALLSLDHALVHEDYTVESFEIFDYAGSDHKAIAIRIDATE